MTVIAFSQGTVLLKLMLFHNLLKLITILVHEQGHVIPSKSKDTLIIKDFLNTSY
jgi:hypothetical protein